MIPAEIPMVIASMISMNIKMGEMPEFKCLTGCVRKSCGWSWKVFRCFGMVSVLMIENN